MGGVDDDVQNHLVEFAEHTGHLRKRLVEVHLERRNIFPLVAGHRNRAFYRTIDVGRTQILTRM